MIGRLGYLLRHHRKVNRRYAQLAETEAALADLRMFSARELADIGLSRSCLTPEGLANCGLRRNNR